MTTHKLHKTDQTPVTVPNNQPAERPKFSERVRVWWSECLVARTASFVWRWAVSLFGSDPKVESAAVRAGIRQPSQVVEKLASNERSVALELGLEILKEKGAEKGFRELMRAMQEGAIDYPFLADLGLAYSNTVHDMLPREKEIITVHLRTFAIQIYQNTIPDLLVSGRLQEALENRTRVVRILDTGHIDHLFDSLIAGGVPEQDAYLFISELDSEKYGKHSKFSLIVDLIRKKTGLKLKQPQSIASILERLKKASRTFSSNSC